MKDGNTRKKQRNCLFMVHLLKRSLDLLCCYKCLYQFGNENVTGTSSSPAHLDKLKFKKLAVIKLLPSWNHENNPLISLTFTDIWQIWLFYRLGLSEKLKTRAQCVRLTPHLYSVWLYCQVLVKGVSRWGVTANKDVSNIIHLIL